MALDQQHWQERLDALADKHGVVGACLAIRHGDQTAEGATGVLNLRTQQPATPDSLFQIGSITKVWTATLVMQLVDDGLLDLDEPIATHLPDFAVADPTVARTATAPQLLCHTSDVDGDLFLDTGRGHDNLETRPVGRALRLRHAIAVAAGPGCTVLATFWWLQRMLLPAEGGADEPVGQTQ